MALNLEIVYLPIEALLEYPGNARTHSKKQINQIAESIRAFGFMNPVIIDKDHQLVAGHGRLLAAKSLNLTALPCIEVKHLTEAQKRAYTMADNRLAEKAGWDHDLLRIELQYLANLNFDIELTGFETPEIDILLGVSEENKDTPPPPLPQSGHIVTRLSDVWVLGPHRLICGDCRDAGVLKRLMARERARLVFTDPPYNVPIDGHARGLGRIHHDDFVMACGELSSEAFIAFLADSLKQLAAVSQEGSLHFVCMDWRHIGELVTAGRAAYTELLNVCVWNKTNAGMGSLYRSQHELIFVFKRGKASHLNHVQLGKYGRYRTNVWNYPGINSFGPRRDEGLALHPTVKPIKLIADAILDVSKRGDAVLDGFTGSGSTLLAAEQTGRRFRGVELDPRYVDVTLHRWMAVTGEMPVLAVTGQSFADAEQERCQHDDLLHTVEGAVHGK